MQVIAVDQPPAPQIRADLNASTASSPAKRTVKKKKKKKILNNNDSALSIEKQLETFA